MQHLTSIEQRQRKSLLRDLLFATLIVAAGAVSILSVSGAAKVPAGEVAHR